MEYETVALELARDAVTYSFIAQKSLTYLDLSTCENSHQIKGIFTEEQCRKRLEPRRKILYTLNLDLPKNLESSLRSAVVQHNTVDQEQHETFYLGKVFICECVYNRNFASCIINSIRLAPNRIEKLKKSLKVIKLLKLNNSMRKAVYLFDRLILVLYPSCFDSNLVVEFAITFQFCNWILVKENREIVDYVLYHASVMRYNIFQGSERRLDPINGCIIFCKPGNISILLQYGTVLRFEPYFYLKLLRQLLGFRKVRRLIRKNIPDRRFFLIIQLFCYFELNQNAEGLIHIWRTIPDPSLVEYEIVYLLHDVIFPEELEALIESYKLYVIEETSGIDDSVPRTLQHLCRVKIRNTLLCNNQIPFGISQLLTISPILRNYLNLKC